MANALYVLINGGPEEWALVRGLEAGQESDNVAVVRFDDVPDELADRVEAEGGPKHVWEELRQLPHQSL